MDGFPRQGATLTLRVFGMVLMPVGPPLPCAPDADALQAATMAWPGG